MRIFICVKVNPLVAPPLSDHKFFCPFIGGEDGCRCAELRAHVCNSCPVCGREMLNTRTEIFNYLAKTAFYCMTSEHLKDYIFARNPWPKHPNKSYAEFLRRLKIKWLACHSHCHIKPAGAYSYHA